MRAVALAIASAIAGAVVLYVSPAWAVGDLGSLAIRLATGTLSLGVVPVPYWIALVWLGTISALLDDIRRSLAQSAADERLTKALAVLRDAPVPADEWGRVREAIMAQINQHLDARKEGRSPTGEEVLRTRRAIGIAWDAAIASRRRPFR